MCNVSGQGTVGLEFLEQVPELDVIVVPIGGKHPYLHIVLRISGMPTLKISYLKVGRQMVHKLSL